MALVIFSSYYLLTFNDLIFNDMPAFLGFVIALSAVVKLQKQKLNFPGIVIYSVIPISLGWQPFAVFAAWTFVDIIEIFQEKKLLFTARIKNITKRPSFIIFVSAILWGSLILGLQLLNEWRIVGGSFLELPSVTSGLWRSGLTSAAGHTNLLWSFDWLTYLPGQFHSIVMMLIPFWPIFQIEPGYNAPIFIVCIFILFIFIRFFSLKDSYIKVLLIMTLSGFFWSIPMKHFVALHDFQAIFYVGFVMSIFLLSFSKINIKPWNILSI